MVVVVTLSFNVLSEVKSKQTPPHKYICGNTWAWQAFHKRLWPLDSVHLASAFHGCIHYAKTNQYLHFEYSHYSAMSQEREK